MLKEKKICTEGVKLVTINHAADNRRNPAHTELGVSAYYINFAVMTKIYCAVVLGMDYKYL